MKTSILNHPKIGTWFLLIPIFFIPPLCINYRVIPVSSVTNLLTLFICSIVCIFIMNKEGWSLEDMDLKVKKGMIPAYVLFTVIGILFLLFMKYIFNLEFRFEIFQRKIFLALFIPLCLLQVISYNLFLLRKLKILTQSRIQLIVLGTIFFAFMHIMFSYKFIIICIIGGIGFSYIYLEYPNLILMTISHSILNMTAAFIGAFNVQ
jgi:membrane protease YdiL (CAAX protease family)